MGLADWWVERLASVEPTLKDANILSAWWSFGLEEGVVEDASDINQCLGIIATTPQGVDPHRPLFASSVHQYLDDPMPTAIPFITKELIGAVRQWEPRVNLVSLTVAPKVEQLSVSAAWELAGGSVNGRLDIQLRGAAA